jgi:RHS repeat-associated protein
MAIPPWSSGTALITNWFDVPDRLTNRLDGLGVTVYQYAMLGSGQQTFGENGPWTGDTDLVTVTNQYGRRVGLAIKQPTGQFVLTNAWDAAGRWAVVGGTADTFSYSYPQTASVQPIGIALPGGGYLTNGYRMGRLTNSELRNPTGALLNRHGYQYNAANQRTLLGRTNSAVSAWNGYLTAAYDAAGQLAQAWAYQPNGTPVTAEKWSYGYDAAQNLSKRTNNLSVETFTVNALNQLTYTRGRDMSGTPAGAGGIGGLLARSHGYSGGAWSSHNFYHADGNGNVTALVNAAGTLQAGYKYDPYGRYLAASGTLASANVMRLSSKPWVAFAGSATSGLYYYGYRFYDPYLQRWLNRDPINEPGFNLLIHSQNPFNLDEEKNLYGFARNNPVMYYDADGRFVPVVAIFFYGNAIGNIGIACYSCKKMNDCLETAKDYTKRAGEGMDPEKFQEWLRATKPGSECTGLMKDCGVRVIQATFWVAGCLLILNYLAK